ncbi:hypothetical protein GCM10027402_05800 [Arthrobacter monumenti]
MGLPPVEDEEIDAGPGSEFRAGAAYNARTADEKYFQWQTHSLLAATNIISLPHTLQLLFDAR